MPPLVPHHPQNESPPPRPPPHFLLLKRSRQRQAHLHPSRCPHSSPSPPPHLLIHLVPRFHLLEVLPAHSQLHQFHSQIPRPRRAHHVHPARKERDMKLPTSPCQWAIRDRPGRRRRWHAQSRCRRERGSTEAIQRHIRVLGRAASFVVTRVYHTCCSACPGRGT